MIEDKLCILVCDAYKAEIRAVLSSGEFPDIELVTYPHVCLNIPGGKDKLENILDNSSRIYKHVKALYDRCAVVSKDSADATGLNGMVRLFQCPGMIADKDLLTYLQANDNNYVVTPGWLRSWREHINQWKFDRDTAQHFFKESTAKIVLLDTGIYDDSEDNLKEFADFMGLSSDSIDIGLDHIRQVVTDHITAWRVNRGNRAKEAQFIELNRQISNYKMMCQVVGTMGKLEDESEVVITVTDFIKILTGVGRIIYTPVIDNMIKDSIPKISILKEEKEIIQRFFESDADYSWHSSDTGFIIRLRNNSETVGLLYVQDAASRERMPDCLNLVLAITNPLNLAISNSRYHVRLQETQELLSLQATTDALTGILNRHTIIERLETEIKRAEREHKPLSVAMMDIDHFKKVNDTYGHSAGDKVLVKVVEQLKASIRPYDYTGRFGGEEFLIVIPGADILDASAICERILSRIENVVVEWQTNNINITVSLGVSTFTGDEKDDVDGLINNADAALYRAKKEGRNRVVHNDIPGVSVKK